MRPVLALLPLFFLFFFPATLESRKDPGEYWKMIMKDQEMPEGIQGLVQLKSEIQHENNSNEVQEHVAEGFKHKCEESLITSAQVSTDKKVFPEEFEPRPNISAYDHDDIDTKVNKKYTEDFEPRPNISAYDDEDIDATKKQNAKTFESRPNISAYNKDGYKDEKSQVNYEFEPRPSATKYNN